MNAAAIVDAVIQQHGTDASRTTVLSVLNEAYASQVVDSRWFRTEASIGTTTAGVAEYVVPASIIEVYGVTVGQYSFEPIGEDVMRRLKQGTQVYATSRGGVLSQGADASGNTTVTLHPTPTTSGDTILVYAAVQPAALTDSTGSMPITPPDTHTSLVDGTAAIILARIDERPDLAASFLNAYTVATEKIRRRKNGLVWGTRPVQMGVSGIHF